MSDTSRESGVPPTHWTDLLPKPESLPVRWDEYAVRLYATVSNAVEFAVKQERERIERGVDDAINYIEQAQIIVGESDHHGAKVLHGMGARILARIADTKGQR